MSWTKEQMKEYKKAYAKKYYQAHKEQSRAAKKAYYQANREKHKAVCKAWREAHKEQTKAWLEANKDEHKAYTKTDVNSLGQTKESIRQKSRRILKKSGIKIPDYQIHHCFTYDDPTKFIYCSKELHLKIHQLLRDNHIDADSNHYEQIKHLLDEKVITFGL